MPRLNFIRPLRPRPAARPPTGNHWLHEPKWGRLSFPGDQGWRQEAVVVRAIRFRKTPTLGHPLRHHGVTQERALSGRPNSWVERAISIAFGSISFFTADKNETVRVGVCQGLLGNIERPNPKSKKEYIKRLLHHRPDRLNQVVGYYVFAWRGVAGQAQGPRAPLRIAPSAAKATPSFSQLIDPDEKRPTQGRCFKANATKVSRNKGRYGAFGRPRHSSREVR
jgi:hypothetical protein